MFTESYDGAGNITSYCTWTFGKPAIGAFAIVMMEPLQVLVLKTPLPGGNCAIVPFSVSIPLPIVNGIVALDGIMTKLALLNISLNNWIFKAILPEVGHDAVPVPELVDTVTGSMSVKPSSASVNVKVVAPMPTAWMATGTPIGPVVNGKMFGVAVATLGEPPVTVTIDVPVERDGDPSRCSITTWVSPGFMNREPGFSDTLSTLT